MDKIRLIPPSVAYADAIAEYRAEFPDERLRVTLDPDRIPGLDYLETFDSVEEWLRFCEIQTGKISWYLSVRERDGRIVGCICIRHKLEYDDDDMDFASHIGYSIRPSEQGNGYGREQLRLALLEADRLGISSVRVICRDTNTASSRVILANGGVFVDCIHGEESGLTVCRYDIRTGQGMSDETRKTYDH